MPHDLADNVRDCATKLIKSPRLCKRSLRFNICEFPVAYSCVAGDASPDSKPGQADRINRREIVAGKNYWQIVGN